MNKNHLNSYNVGSMLIPAVVGIVFWSLPVYWLTSSDVPIWDYWGIGFYRVVFLTFGLHSLLIAIVLSLMFNVGHLAEVRKKTAIIFLLPFIVGGVLVGLIPSDLNVVARKGLLGAFELPLFWLTLGSIFYFFLVRRIG